MSRRTKMFATPLTRSPDKGPILGKVRSSFRSQISSVLSNLLQVAACVRR